MESIPKPDLTQQNFRNCATRQVTDALILVIKLVGAGRFELPTPTTPLWCATRLRYAPTLCLSPLLQELETPRHYGEMRRNAARARIVVNRHRVCQWFRGIIASVRNLMSPILSLQPYIGMFDQCAGSTRRTA